MPRCHIAWSRTQLHKSVIEKDKSRGNLGAMKANHCGVSLISLCVLDITRFTAHTMAEHTANKGYLDKTATFNHNRHHRPLHGRGF